MPASGYVGNARIGRHSCLKRISPEYLSRWRRCASQVADDPISAIWITLAIVDVDHASVVGRNEFSAKRSRRFGTRAGPIAALSATPKIGIREGGAGGDGESIAGPPDGLRPHPIDALRRPSPPWQVVPRPGPEQTLEHCGEGGRVIVAKRHCNRRHGLACRESRRRCDKAGLLTPRHKTEAGLFPKQPGGTTPAYAERRAPVADRVVRLRLPQERTAALVQVCTSWKR